MERLTRYEEIRGCYVMKPHVQQGLHIQKLGAYEDLEEELEDIKADICDRYCKHTERYENKPGNDEKMYQSEWERKVEEQCSVCPFCKLEVRYGQ